jgi:hypothetical protein
MAGAVFVTQDLIWTASSSGLHWVGEFLFDHLEDPQAREYVREILDNNIGSLALDDFSPTARHQVLNLLRDELVDDARERLSPDPIRRQNYLEALQELEEMARAVPR